MYYNALICPKCENTIVSLYRHDFYKCPCGTLTVDGGFDYGRVLYNGDPTTIGTPSYEQILDAVRARVLEETDKTDFSIPKKSHLDYYVEELESFNDGMMKHLSKEDTTSINDLFDHNRYKPFDTLESERIWEEEIDLRCKLINNLSDLGPTRVMRLMNLSPCKYMDILIGEAVHDLTLRMVPRSTKEEIAKKLNGMTSILILLSNMLLEMGGYTPESETD